MQVFFCYFLWKNDDVAGSGGRIQKIAHRKTAGEFFLLPSGQNMN